MDEIQVKPGDMSDVLERLRRCYLALAVVREAWDEGPLTAEHIAVVDKAMAMARGE